MALGMAGSDPAGILTEEALFGRGVELPITSEATLIVWECD